MLRCIAKYLCILISFLLLISCGLITDTNTSTIIKGARIEVPNSPKPLGISGQPGVTSVTNTIVDPPLVAEPFQYWRAYKDGAIIWKPKDWRLIDEHVKTCQNWILTTSEQIKIHNKIFDTDLTETNSETPRRWYHIW